MRVGRRYFFRAQHHVPGLPEPWCSPHWHDYTVEVVSVDVSEDVRADHEALDELGADLVRRIDGQNLNDIWSDTTVEGLAVALRYVFKADEVTVWEDNDRWATA